MTDSPKCGAKTRFGEPCKRRPAVNRTRCILHGGATPIGVNSGSWRHGRYSKYLPVRLVAQYTASMTDPELLSGKSEISLLDSRLAELLTRVDAGATGRLWDRLMAARTELMDARRRRDPEATASALAAILDLIQTGCHDSETWEEIYEVADKRRKHAASEARRLNDQRHSVSVESVITALRVIATAIRLNVEDPATRRRVLQSVSELTVISGISPTPLMELASDVADHPAV
jgi:hypothetical protein